MLKSKHFPLSFASSLLATEPELRVLLLVRDPRGVLTHSKQVGQDVQIVTLSKSEPNLRSPPVPRCCLLGAGPRLGRGAAAGHRVPRQVPARQVRGVDI